MRTHSLLFEQVIQLVSHVRYASRMPLCLFEFLGNRSKELTKKKHVLQEGESMSVLPKSHLANTFRRFHGCGAVFVMVFYGDDSYFVFVWASPVLTGHRSCRASNPLIGAPPGCSVTSSSCGAAQVKYGKQLRKIEEMQRRQSQQLIQNPGFPLRPRGEFPSHVWSRLQMPCLDQSTLSRSLLLNGQPRLMLVACVMCKDGVPCVLPVSML